jgi:hypothetical protein
MFHTESDLLTELSAEIRSELVVEVEDAGVYAPRKGFFHNVLDLRQS